MSRRLLIVEDDVLLAKAMERLLRRAGFDPLVVPTCAEARAVQSAFSVGIYDIDLPDGDGVDLAQELLGKGTARRAVFFSGTAEAGARLRATRVGPFIEKTRGMSALVQTLDALLHSKKQVAGGDDVVGGSSVPPPSGVRMNEDE
jgi:DNA-binding response OmpR family regulator